MLPIEIHQVKVAVGLSHQETEIIVAVANRADIIVKSIRQATIKVTKTGR